MVSPHPLDIPADELQKIQAADKTLGAVSRAAEGEPSSAGIGFFKRGRLLYRRWQTPGQDAEMAVEQLVLPLSCRATVLELAHSIPFVGHLGRDKTTRRILQRFYWPTTADDAESVRRWAAGVCGECPSSHYRWWESHSI